MLSGKNRWQEGIFDVLLCTRLGQGRFWCFAFLPYCLPVVTKVFNGRNVGKRRFCCSLLLSLLLSGAPSICSGEISLDELLRQLVVGNWVQVSDVYAVTEFSAIMQYEAYIYRSAQMIKPLGHLKGVWRVEDGQLQIRLTEASSPRLSLGVFISEKINYIDGRKMVLTDANGERYTKLRLR